MKLIHKCRVCGAETIPYFDYGMMPLVNQLFQTEEEAKAADRHRLELSYCPSCYMSQISVVVDPEILYANYPYRSSTSQTFKDHCRALAYEIREVAEGGVVLDIAGNDGALLQEFCSVLPGIQPVLVDPSEAIESAGYDIMKFRRFWDQNTVDQLLACVSARPMVITAQNVVGHVDDIHGFFAAVKRALHPQGVFVVEVPHVLDMLSTAAYETVYHEHLSYLSLTALEIVGNENGLHLIRASKHPIHCGTIRATFAHHGQHMDMHEGVDEILCEEEDILEDEWTYDDFSRGARKRMERLEIALDKDCIGITASAKGNVMLNAYRTSAGRMRHLVDDTEEKQNKYAPGIGLKILPMSNESLSAPSAVILAKNIEAELTTKLRAQGFAGKIVCP